jgi:L-asparagine transporter-like permease
MLLHRYPPLHLPLRKAHQHQAAQQLRVVVSVVSSILTMRKLLVVLGKAFMTDTKVKLILLVLLVPLLMPRLNRVKQARPSTQR